MAFRDRRGSIYRTRAGYAFDATVGLVKDHFNGSHYQFGKFGNCAMVAVATAISPLGFLCIYGESFYDLERVSSQRDL